MTVIAHDAVIGASNAAFAQAGVACVGLDELTASADVISRHVPLVASTRHLFDAKRIAAMKPGAVLINSARGGVIDEAALAAAFKRGRLGGAALDVFEAEPMPAGGVRAGCPNLVLMPHIAGVSSESNERVSFMIAQRVLEQLG